MLIGVHDLRDTVEEMAGTWAALAVYRAVLIALPEPIDGGNRLYLFVYRFAHAIGLSVEKLRKNNAGTTK